MIDKTLDEAVLRSWIGRTETTTDHLDLRPARLMHTILLASERRRNGDILPSLWHWLYFPTEAPLAQLGRDGHPQLGDFLPPVDLPRRMWAGGRLTFPGVLRIGDTVEKRSTIKDVRLKAGRSGMLCFVTVHHALSVGGTDRVIEEHDIVYRDDPAPDTPSPEPVEPPKNAETSEEIVPSPVMLFRYSAITFNGHRIHYDRDYCREVEGYPGLVFHGPLTATLLADLGLRRRAEKMLTRFEFRAVSPLFDTAPFTISARSEGAAERLWASGPEGNLAMQATAEFD